MVSPQLQSGLERYQIIRPYLEGEASLSYLTRQYNVALSTLKRWVNAYREHGMGGLERSVRSDKNVRKTVSPELVQFTEALAIHHEALSISAIHRQVAKVVAERGEDPPSYHVIRSIIGKIEPSLIALAKNGSKSYEESYGLLYRRKTSCSNQIWQADHCMMDIVLLDENDKPRRPWLTAILDDYSRAVCGYYLSFNAPCSHHTALALRQAIWRKVTPEWQVCGIPEIFYTDNGSDFTSNHIAHVAADLKIQLQRSIPGKPQGRGLIERFFRSVNQLFLIELPGYIIAGKEKPVPVLTLPDFSDRFENFITQDYHKRIHSGTGEPPVQRWAGSGFLPQMPVSLEQLDELLLMVPKPRRVHRDGIRFQGLVYIDTTLAAYVGEDVIIRYDPRDMGEIRVYYQNSFLCRAICQEMADQTITLKEITAARNRRKRQLRQIISQRKSLMDAMLPSSTNDRVISHQKPSPTKNNPSHALKLYHND